MPLEWRTVWAESGTTELSGQDASLVVRLAMDLVDQQEGTLIEKRKKELQKKNEIAARIKLKQHKLGQLHQFLTNRLAIVGDIFEGKLLNAAANA